MTATASSTDVCSHTRITVHPRVSSAAVAAASRDRFASTFESHQSPRVAGVV